MILPTHKCFDDALDYLTLRARERADLSLIVVVHGVCRDPELGRYAHAWVEEGDRVVQGGIYEGQRVFWSVAKEEFLREYDVIHSTRYSVRDVMLENLRTGHYGPWIPEYRELCRDKKGMGSTMNADGRGAGREALR